MVCVGPELLDEVHHQSHLEHGGVGPEEVLVPGQREHLHLVPEPVLDAVPRVAPLGARLLLQAVALVPHARVVGLLHSAPAGH